MVMDKVAFTHWYKGRRFLLTDVFAPRIPVDLMCKNTSAIYICRKGKSGKKVAIFSTNRVTPFNPNYLPIEIEGFLDTGKSLRSCGVLMVDAIVRIKDGRIEEVIGSDVNPHAILSQSYEIFLSSHIYSILMMH